MGLQKSPLLLLLVRWGKEQGLGQVRSPACESHRRHSWECRFPQNAMLMLLIS